MTEIKTPTSTADFAEVMDSMPAAPASAVQHHVRGTWLVAQQAENLLGLLCLANHPEVQHGFTP